MHKFRIICNLPNFVVELPAHHVQAFGKMAASIITQNIIMAVNRVVYGLA